MRYRVLLGELLPVCGTLGLLGLWLFQQTGIEHRAGELRKIAAARSVYQTYQSHNAVFNAVGEVATNAATKARLRALQTYNYEFGLSAIADALPADQKVGIPPAPTGYFDGSPPIEDMMARTQKRLELLQVRLSKYEQSVSAPADADKQMYLALYLVISAVSLAGALLKVVDKLASSKPVLQ